MNATDELADLIRPRSVLKGDTDWFTIVDLISGIVRIFLLGQGCQPEPAVTFLTKEFGPLQKALGAERRRERRIRDAIKKTYKGPADKLPEVTENTLAMIRSGRLTPKLMRGIYAEVQEADRATEDFE